MTAAELTATTEPQEVTTKEVVYCPHCNALMPPEAATSSGCPRCKSNGTASATASRGGYAQSEATPVNQVPPEERASSKRLLEEYVVGEALGEGAFGVVYACTCRKTGQEVAVKMVDKVETPTEAIRREAEIMKSLSHKNIVKFHAVFFERCFVCIVMDKYSGGDLVEGMQHHLKERGKINARDIIHISFQMAASIQHLHSRSIAHRDIKGDNFLMDRIDILDKDCHIALSDFGTAAVLSPGERLSSEVGTRIFWAPELFSRDYGVKVDIWALGIIMYGLLDGRFPFKDEHDIKTKEPKYPRRLDPLCEEFIRTMLQKQEAERASADEIIVHSWLCPADIGEASRLLKPGIERVGTHSSLEGPNFNHEEINVGVVERRGELVERLKNEHTKEQNTSTFRHVSSLALFSVPDRRNPGVSITYEWWDPEKVRAAGLLARDGIERTLEEVAAELDRSPHLVGQLLKDHNIDITKFGQGEAKTLEQLASEVQSGAARLMLDATSHRKLVRVVDVVLLRLSAAKDKDCLLIEVGEQYPDGRRRTAYRVPGTKKFPHENSQETAMRVLKEFLSMDSVTVSFDFDSKEVYEEEMDSPSFPGVRTVYRKEIVQCYVDESNEERLRSIGLPDGSKWSAEDEKHNVKFFAWMSEADALKMKVKLRAEGSEEVSGLVMPPVGLNEKDLTECLLRHNVDISLFGKAQAKSLKDFSKDLMSGECSLLLDAHGQVIRVIDRVVLVLVSPSNKILVQAALVTADGARHPINRLPASKGRPDESQFVTARRILRKQLRIDENQVRLDPKKAKIYEETRPSPSVPGMQTVYRRRFIEAAM